MGRGGTVLGIIGIILAAGAIGFTFVVWNGQNTANNLTQPKVVGIWDSLWDNQDYTPYNSLNDWLLEFGGNSLIDPGYISLSNTNTRITLLKAGWYRIHLSALLTSITFSNMYRIRILKDGVNDFILDFYETEATIVNDYHTIDSSAFIYSDGTNYIEIRGYSLSDFFFVPTNDLNNQLTIEFVAI